ncbi:fatty acid synthase-like [Anticarsia gemmatalis]|uniref:fatty acid synthase-like n=1 Tax=Anticarsia gemmatalis TaxID=129554 RepID=UPI003F76E106
MTPTPEVHVSTEQDFIKPPSPGESIADGDRIVISGISGLYPEANNIKEFSEILYNKENPITSENLRWAYKHPELAQYVGKAPGLDHFDAQFFTVYYRLCNYMDPMSRKMLEQTYQAIYDAGLSPGCFNGKKVAVFIGSSFSDTEKDGFINSVSQFGLGIIGSSKTMFANRISYWLNTKGPSLAIDEADCSSTTALEQAYLAIRRGDCEAAIVGGAHLCLHPQAFIHHARIGLVSKDGKTNSFAENAQGYALSDAVNVLVLQKSKDALRCYAELVHVKNEFISVKNTETGPQFGYDRNIYNTAKFIKDFYEEARVVPQVVEYVEGYGTGVPDVDKSELEAIEKVYCEDREDPLLVGSVTSNVGLTEAAAGITGITKVLLAYHSGKLAATMNCEKPRKDILALRDNRMRIVNEHEVFGRGYSAVNGMSCTGVNSHVLLNGHYKPKDLSRYKSTIPHLVTLSGRQESSVVKVFDILKSHPVDAEEIALLHSIHSNNISGHLGRGYIVLDTNAENETVSLCEKAEYFDDVRKPLWFVYSGMGSQWAGMGAQLMRIPIFAAAIERCRKVLEPKGIDIVHIITSTDKTIFDNILHSFVGIAAVQIGLTDILTELGLVPDGIIGHSVGELGCAYGDGCLTAEEMILAAYSRGLVSLQTPLIRGSMAAVGLGYKQISTMCPPEIDVACRNGPGSSTISGPADVMREFVAQLTAKGVFAKEVPCSNIAYHSRYIADAGPHLLKYLNEVIKHPKPRSERWISSSVPQNKWNEESAKLCSAEYHTNNLLNPVLFEETSRLIPSNAVLVEIAPHGLLQAILKRSLSESCRHVPLTRRGHPDNALFLLQAIGNLYMEGYAPRVQALYPKVQFPVSTETPMLSHMVEWVHVEKWAVTKINDERKKTASACKFVKSVHDPEYSYLQGNVIRGKMCYPFAAALVAAWDTFAMNAGVPRGGVSVQFFDVHLYAQPLLFDQRPLKLNVALHRGTGRFEITSECSRVATGYMNANQEELYRLQKYYTDNNASDFNAAFTSDDIYQLLRERDYKYNGELLSIESANESLTEANLVWRDNWVTLIDGMLQLNVLRQQHDAVSLPTQIRRIVIDVKKHADSTTYDLNGKLVMKAIINEVHELTRCGGVLIQNVKFRNLPPVNHTLQKYELHVPSSEVSKPNGAALNGDNMAKNMSLQCAEIGNLDSLHWIETPQLEQTNLTVTVHYAGMNMFDVKRATGVSTCDSNVYGMDYSGITKSGVRVMGIVRSGAASTQLQAQSELLWPVPAHWSLEDAATVPYAYAHAFYALVLKGRLETGMYVLVHGAAGALGQAVISIALAQDCQVFATVSSIRKKQFLKKMFPQLKDEHIGNSRDISFSDNVVLATGGRGCNIVISCVKEGLRNVSLNCCGFGGMLIDTVQIQDREDYEYGMSYMTKQRAYSTIDFSSVFTSGNYQEMELLQKMVSDGIARGYVVPLSRVTYTPDEVTRAFRLLAGSRHCGRVLLRLHDNAPPTQHSITCAPEKCQILLWDDDVIGVQLADRLIKRGARKLYIQCSKSTSYQNIKIRSWRKNGVEVVESIEDLTSVRPQAALFNDAMTLGSIEGIFIVITRDINKQPSDPSLSLENLDSVSRLLCPQLKYFVVVTTAKNAEQDICVSRAKAGYSATYLDLSTLSDDDVLESREVVEAAEQALISDHTILIARKKHEQPPTLLEQLAGLADINVPRSVGKDINLHQLGMADEKVPLLSAFLNVTHNISLDEKDIPFLTVEKIIELENLIAETVPDNIKGLPAFFSKTGSDELLSTADLVVLPTQYQDVVQPDNEFEISGQYLCIVPGMEGHHERFSVLCERLKLPALVLQPGLDHPQETVRDTALRCADILTNKTELQDNFYLLGYESGVLVALELAAILEDKGLTGTVFCIGYAPDEFAQELEEHLSDLQTEEELQNSLIRHMFTLMADCGTERLDKALQSATTWAQKVDACVRCLLGNMTHSAQYAQAVIEAALARIQQVRRHKVVARPLRSRLVLLRASTTNTTFQPSALQQHSQQPVVVHQLEWPLAHVLYDTHCSSFVNECLDEELLNAFKEKNLCEFSHML